MLCVILFELLIISFCFDGRGYSIGSVPLSFSDVVYFMEKVLTRHTRNSRDQVHRLRSV